MAVSETPGVPTLGRFKRVPLREVWISEAGSFTPWLAAEGNLAILSETLGLSDIELIQTEQPVGPFRADIVCRAVDGEFLVLIENQIERSDHTHLGQVLTYASGLEAAVVVWITSQFTEEHRSVIDWLNRIIADDFHFFGVEIEAWQIDESAPAPRFNIVAQPNEWTRAVRNSARQVASSPPDPVLAAYWTALSDEITARGLPLHVRDEPPRLGYYTFTLSRACRIYLTAFRNVSRKSIGVYIALYEAPALAIFQRWSAQRESIEAELGTKLSWAERTPGSSYHISLQREGADPLNEADWPDQIAWMCDQLDRFYKVFKPLVDALPDAQTLIEEAEEMASEAEPE